VKHLVRFLDGRRARLAAGMVLAGIALLLAMPAYACRSNEPGARIASASNAPGPSPEPAVIWLWVVFHRAPRCAGHLAAGT